MSLDQLGSGFSSSMDVASQTILINGSPLSGEIQISQIVVRKSYNKIASAKVVLLDGSTSDRDFEQSNSSTFIPGNTITIQLGYHGNVETVFEGIIIRHGVKVRNQTSILTIEAKDTAIALTAARKSAYYIDKTDSDVIEELAGSFSPDVDSTSVSHHQLIQYNATDWDFILTRAEANGMLVLTDDGTLIVKKPDTTSDPVLTITYGDNIYEFEAEMDARHQIQQITSHSWDYTQQAVETSDPGSSDYTENGNLSSDDLAGVLAAEVELIHGGHLEASQLQAWSDSWSLRNHLSKSVGRVQVDGSSLVKPGTMISLDGVGDRFNGTVLVTGVLHRYEGQWKTDIQFGWRDDWFYKKEDIIEKPASGLLPGITGLQIGVVLDVNDSEGGGQYRVKVYIPTITSSNEGLWARVATLDAGSDRGVYFRPQVSDEVILGFISDDPREPVILGYLHSKDSKKSPLPEQDGMEQYGIVTKEGIKLVFDDTNKRLSVTVPTGAGEKSLVMNSDASAIELKDENQNSIKMDASGITIQAGTGIVTIKGTQVLIN